MGTSSSRPPLFDAIQERKIGPDICFLCGETLTNDNRTDEHVVPSWVQKEFDLPNQLLNLLNGSPIPYRQVTIPCCADCNRVHLGKIENRIRKALRGGPAAFRDLDQLDLFIWLGKIFYGLLYKEQFLSADRRKPDGSPIVPIEMLQEFQMHHYFLQSARLRFQFREFFPASIFIFGTQTSSHRRFNFDLRDHWPAMSIAIRIGSVGLVATLQDGGAQRLGHFKDLVKYQKLILHPLQFRELSAMFFYKSSLMNRVPKYFLSENNGSISVSQMPLGGLSKKSIFDDWDKEDYAKLLSHHTELPLETVFVPPKSVMTWLHSPDGRTRTLPWDGEEYL